MKTSNIDQILLNCVSIAEKRIEINIRRVQLESQYEDTNISIDFKSDPFIIKKRNEIKQIRNFTQELLSETIKNQATVVEIEGGLNNYISNRSIFVTKIGHIFMSLNSKETENEFNIS